MKSFLIAFIIFLIWAFFGLWLYSWLQTNKEPTAALTETPNNIDTLPDENKALDTNMLKENKLPFADTLIKGVEKKSTTMVAKNEEGAIVFLFEEGIISHKNSPEINIPKSSIDFKYKINTYLIEHPDKEIYINSLYSADEDMQTPNLGIKRGRNIKDILVETGVPSEKIVVKPVIKDLTFLKDGAFKNSISFTFKPLDKNRIEEEEIKLPESVQVYPKFSETGIIVNNNLRNLLEDVKTALENNPETTIEIIGHTDNVGNANDNYRMGLQYARQVRWYLISKGDFEKSVIKASSKGESDPIDTNNTTRGREANRRIEVVYNYNE